VYLIATGPHTWTFSHRMPEHTQVYGGAGRVYPTGHAWVTDHRRSPLRFAYDEDEGRRATHHLISDALTMALAAGSGNRRPEGRQADGVVLGIVGERAIVEVDGIPAHVKQELTVPGVPLHRVLAPALRVRGTLAAGSRLFDVRESLLDAEQVLAAYGHGDLVLAEVIAVRLAEAVLRLHPDTKTVVPRDAVTGNDKDDLRMLMTPGEVVRARVLRGAPGWRLSLLDVEDDEEPVPAVALLPGGPPWLTETEAADREASPRGGRGATAAESKAGPLVRREPTPTPAEAMRRVAAAARAPSAPTGPTVPTIGHKGRVSAASQMSLKIAALEAELTAVHRHVGELEDQLAGGAKERDDLIAERRELQRTIAQRDEQLKRARTDLRRAKRPARALEERGEPQFADRERGFRHAVEAAWARRFPLAEQPRRPLAAYTLGPGFLDSVDALHGASTEKIVDVVVEILTGLVEGMPGRAAHRKRVSAGAGSRYVTRDDGASLWRAAIETHTPQARRIEYWKAGSSIELDNVDLHDGRLD